MKTRNAIGLMALGVAAAIASGCSHEQKMVELNRWELRYGGAWHEARVPGFVHQDLMRIGAIGDPYYGTNEATVQWVGDSVWRYRTLFSKSEVTEDSCDLVFEGLSTLCRIRLNGKEIGRSDNMFRTYRYRLLRSELEAENEIEVTFEPVGRHNDSAAAALPYPIPDRRTLTRSAPYQQGWDWGPTLSSCGIWQRASLQTSRRRPDAATGEADTTLEGLRFEIEADSVGLAYRVTKEGRPLFAKGANWIPAHTFPVADSEQRERYRRLLTSAKEANFNMIRVWGGGIYEPDYFYELCDSLGLMVWQDFNFSCALYPSDSAFLDNVRREAEEQVRRIAKHACVVVWCGNNEVQNGWEDWGWQQQYGWGEAEQALLRRGIDTLFGEHGVLAEAVRRYDPKGRPYLPTSPLYGWGHKECCTHGDSHYWGVWWGEEPFEAYGEKTGRFMTEYGFQSYPEWSTIQRFCPEKEQRIDAPTMRAHQKHGRGVEIIDAAMRRYYGMDSQVLTLEEYCYVSQLLQAWGVGYGIVQHLLKQPHCMGTLYWQLNDSWPVASWSSIDYYGNWKALHYRAQALYAEGADLQRWGRYYSTYPKDVPLDSARYTLERSLEAGVLTVCIEAETALRDVWVETQPHVDGHFTSNFFDLEVGEKKTIRFVPWEPGQTMESVAVKIHSLNDLRKKMQR